MQFGLEDLKKKLELALSSYKSFSIQKASWLWDANQSNWKLSLISLSFFITLTFPGENLVTLKNLIKI